MGDGIATIHPTRLWRASRSADWNVDHRRPAAEGPMLAQAARRDPLLALRAVPSHV